jgi:hypothetical protein
MGTHAIETGAGLSARLGASAGQHLRWLVSGFVLAFLVPFVLADLLEVPRDLYYALYIVGVAAFFGLWVRATGQSFGEMLRRRWVLALVIGLAVAGLLTLIVLRTEDATARPGGLELIGAVMWRGVAYGLADGLLLSAFPILAVFAMFAGTKTRERLLGTVAIGLAALAASLAMTAAYHLGYRDFRSEKLRKPVAGDVVWSIPTLVTLNPIGAPIAHAGIHTSAVLHSYETDTYLPPHE